MSSQTKFGPMRQFDYGNEICADISLWTSPLRGMVWSWRQSIAWRRISRHTMLAEDRVYDNHMVQNDTQFKFWMNF